MKQIKKIIIILVIILIITLICILYLNSQNSTEQVGENQNIEEDISSDFIKKLGLVK